ncbi:MAG TPA: hypothetical protein VJ019_01125 [Aestuariivirga sp.]|nr:hypothetical protein [Aestuariivirga sp.]
MAPNPQLEPRPKAITRSRDLAYRSSEDVSTPLLVILAIIGFATVLSFVLTWDWSSKPDFPTVTETLPAPDINSNVAPAPATPPATAQDKS